MKPVFGLSSAKSPLVLQDFFSIDLFQGMEAYLDYAQGYNLTNRMPLWVVPTQPLDVKDAIDLMRDHYEGLHRTQPILTLNRNLVRL